MVIFSVRCGSVNTCLGKLGNGFPCLHSFALLSCFLWSIEWTSSYILKNLFIPKITTQQPFDWSAFRGPLGSVTRPRSFPVAGNGYAWVPCLLIDTGFKFKLTNQLDDRWSNEVRFGEACFHSVLFPQLQQPTVCPMRNAFPNNFLSTNE